MRILFPALFALQTTLAACSTTSAQPTSSETGATPVTSTALTAPTVTVWSDRYQCRSVAPDEEAAACEAQAGPMAFGAQSTCQGTEEGFDAERDRLELCTASQSCPCACMRIVKCQ